MAAVSAAHTPDDEPRLIAGRYRLIATLGQGGMGVTYRAWDRRHSVPVVIKLPKPRLRGDGVALRRFARESEAMLRLRHDHIVPIIDRGEDDGRPFVAMRFLPGGTVAHQRRYDARGVPQPVSPDRLTLWLPSIAGAIDFIHDHGVLHRDIKPANIFFDGFMNAFLGDFGIAKAFEDSDVIARDQTITATHAAVGTLEYMAPEWFIPKSKPDRRSDQYSLAVMVYELIAGRKPFSGETAHIIVEHASHAPPLLDRQGLKLPSGLCLALERALSKKPDERFETCSEFVTALLASVVPSPHEPGIARLVCPECNRLMRLPVASRGSAGRCPSCACILRIAEDVSALWRLGEEEGREHLADGRDTGARPVELLSSSEGNVGGEAPVAAQSAVGGRQGSPWVWVSAMSAVLAVTMSLAVGVATHLRWSGYHEQQLATALAERQTLLDRSRREIAGLEAGRDKQVQEAADNEEYIADLRAEIALLEGAAKNSGGQLMQSALAVVPRDGQQGSGLEPREGTNEDGGNPTESYPRESDEMMELQPPLAVIPAKTLTLDEAKQRVLRSRGKGRRLDFNDVTALTDDAAAYLSKTTYELQFHAIETLTPPAAESLAKHQGGLSVVGLKTLSAEAAEALAKYQGPLMLCRLETLTPEVARSLVLHSGHLHLRRSGLPALTPEVAKALAAHRGSLTLDYLPTLTLEVAKALANHKGSLTLDHLPAPTLAVANALASHQGSLTLDHLTTLTPAVADALAMHNGSLHLGSDSATLTPQVAQSLATCRGRLTLHGLTTLTPEVAEALANHKGSLAMDRLATLTPEVAEALAKHTGDLSLKGLTTMTIEVAVALRNHEGNLNLGGLRKVSPTVATILQWNRAIDFPLSAIERWTR